MAVKKIKTPDEELRDYLIQVLRREFRKNPVYNEAKKEAKEEYHEVKKDGTKGARRVHFKCAMCKRYFVDREGTREITVDHVDGVIDPKIGFVDWNTYIDRMYKGRLQVLCKYPGERDGQISCHKIKTAEERTILAETKRRLKAEVGSVKPVS